MGTTEASVAPSHYLLRRLHSLTGLVPIGVFLIFHLTTNSSILWGMANGRADHAETLRDRGVETFQHEVTWINNMPGLLLIEIVLWASIAFHAVLGVSYARSGRNNVARYAYQGNRRYALQRLTGYLAIFFIFYHVATLRWGWSFLVPGGATWSHEFAASTLAQALRGSSEGITIGGIGVSVFYFVGVSASVFHFANGLWTAAITWGITISTRAQRRWGVVCAGLGTMLMLMAWGALLGFLFTDPARARGIERGMHDQPAAIGDGASASIDASYSNPGGNP